MRIPNTDIDLTLTNAHNDGDCDNTDDEDLGWYCISLRICWKENLARLPNAVIPLLKSAVWFRTCLFLFFSFFSDNDDADNDEDGFDDDVDENDDDLQ